LAGGIESYVNLENRSQTQRGETEKRHKRMQHFERLSDLVKRKVEELGKMNGW
jgi:hypothetical protein